MKKNFWLSTSLVIPLLLTGCDSDSSLKEQCIKLQHEAGEAFRGKGDRNGDEIRKDWDDLKCDNISLTGEEQRFLATPKNKIVPSDQLKTNTKDGKDWG